MSREDTSKYKEVFDYIYEQDPASASTDRALGLGHFDFLAKQLGFSLDDLSMYVLAYSLNCTHTQCKFDILENEFINGLRAVLPSTTKINKNDRYQTAFTALADSVKKKNRAIHEDIKELEKFYLFIYNWCLRSNKADDRTEIAQELWNLFFTTVEGTPSRDVFKGYVCFKRLPDWQAFVSSPAFKPYRVSQDLWQQLRLFSAIESYDQHDPDGAWPVAIDGFVEWIEERIEATKETAKKA